MNDSLSDRIKKYENTFNYKYPIRLPLIIRLDGVHFHSNVKKWKCEKPFDETLIESMIFTAKTLCENIAGAQIAYVQSDEITILIRDDMSIYSQPWFDKKINKIYSVSSSIASNAFNYNFFNSHALGVSVNLNEMAQFDCRGFVVPEYEINNVFIWRQQDCTRNSIQMLGRSKFSHKQLDKKSCNEIQDMLMTQKNINWNNLPTHLKRGTCIIKEETYIDVPKRDHNNKIIPNHFDKSKRKKWIVDKEIPIFTKDKDYIGEL